MLSNAGSHGTPGRVPQVLVTVGAETGAPASYQFEEEFRVGRDPSCEVQILHGKASRIHLEVRFDGQRWWATDPGSTNGTYRDGQRVERVPVEGALDLRIGADGPVVHLAVGDRPAAVAPAARPERAPRAAREAREATTPAAPRSYAGREEPVATPRGATPAASPPASGSAPADPSVSFYVQRYFNEEGEAGEHTRMIRQAFRQVQTRQKRRYTGVIVVLVLLGLGGAAFGGFKAYALRQEQARLAMLERQTRDLFYEMKQLEVKLGASAQIAQMQRRYEQHLTDLKVHEDLSEEEKLIYRVARLFGECDLDMPPGFVLKVKEYIARWQGSPRLASALLRARENNYTYPIVKTFLEHDLPPQFFYLALQESNFDRNIVGPPTRYGHAKGMWQFIPATAMQYGLQTGPLVQIAQTDPMDERHDFEKSTRAAAKYIRYIYDTDAQASGLLVMASYNWGEGNVLRFIRELPENPRERNFWKLIERYEERIPDETYNYVFYIFSAAVIGENPSLFGFDFENPLAYAIEAASDAPAVNAATP